MKRDVDFESPSGADAFVLPEPLATLVLGNQGTSDKASVDFTIQGPVMAVAVKF